MKLLFLDVDGVLNSMGKYYSSMYYVNDECKELEESHIVKLYNLLKEDESIKLVLSSSWDRAQFEEKMKNICHPKVHDLITNRFVDFNNGVTIKNVNLYKEYMNIPDNKNSIYVDTISQEDMIHNNTLTMRGHQIWLTLLAMITGSIEHEYKIESIVIVDDEIIDICGHKCDKILEELVVGTDYRDGISHQNIEDIKKVLSKKLTILELIMQHSRSTVMKSRQHKTPRYGKEWVLTRIINSEEWKVDRETEYLNIWIPPKEHLHSNCCDSRLIENTILCSKCKEACSPILNT